MHIAHLNLLFCILPDYFIFFSCASLGIKFSFSIILVIALEITTCIPNLPSVMLITIFTGRVEFAEMEEKKHSKPDKQGK